MKTLIRLATVILFGLLSATMCAAQRPNTDGEVLTPVIVKTDLYPANADAKKEIEGALTFAANENKRVMLIFGGKS
jgi:hypothetical protein